MNINELVENRNGIDRAELMRHLGQWVAFSGDGSELLAGAETLEQLETILVERQIDPQTVFFEFIPGSEQDDILFSPESTDEIPVPE